MFEENVYFVFVYLIILQVRDDLINSKSNHIFLKLLYKIILVISMMFSKEQLLKDIKAPFEQTMNWTPHKTNLIEPSRKKTCLVLRSYFFNRAASWSWYAHDQS